MNMVKLRNGGFATSSWDGTVKIFDDKNYNLIQTIKEPKLNDISYVTQLNDDSLLICSNIMQKIKLSSVYIILGIFEEGQILLKNAAIRSQKIFLTPKN